MIKNFSDVKILIKIDIEISLKIDKEVHKFLKLGQN